MATAIQFLRSSIEQLRPNPVSLSEGMPMVNLNSAEPGLFFRLSDNSLAKIGPTAIGPNAPNSSPTGHTGNTVGELWLDTTSTPTQPRPLFNVWDGSQWIPVDGGIGLDELPVPRNAIFAGPPTGTDAVPTFRPMVEEDLPPNLSPSILGGGTTPGVLLIGGAGGWAENLLQSDPSISIVNSDNLITVGVRAGDIAGTGSDGTNLTGDGHVQLNVNGTFTADNRFKFDTATGNFVAQGSTSFGVNQLTDTHDIFGGTTVRGDLQLTDLYSLNVGGNAVVGHNMTIGSDPTELLDVFNRTEFNADVFINAPSNLDVGGNIIVQGETQLGNTDVQGLVVNATSQILADLTVGRNCFDVFTIDSTATFNCDTTFNGGVDLNGNIDISGDVQLGSDCSNTITASGTFLSNCDIIVGTNATTIPGGAQVFTVDADTGNVATSGFVTIGSDLTVSGSGAITGNFNVTGNTDIDGTLDVQADAVLQSDLEVGIDLLVRRDAEIARNLGVAGLTTINGALNVNNSATITDDLTVLGSTILGDDCLTDTLTVQSVAEFLCEAVFQDSVTFNGPVIFEDLTINGDTVIGDNCTEDTLTVTAVTDFNCVTTFNEAVTIGASSADTLTVQSSTTVTGPALFTEDVTIGNQDSDILTVASTSTFSADVIANADVTLGDAATDSLTVNSTSTFAAPVTVANTFVATEDVTLGNFATDTLTVGATAEFNSPVRFRPAADFIADGDVTVGLAASDAFTVNSTALLLAPVTIDNALTVNGNTIIGTDCASDTLDVTAVTTFNCDVTFNSPVAFEDLTVNGNTILGDAAADTLVVTATSTFNSPVTIDSTLNVTGNITLGDDCTTDTLDVTAVTTFNCETFFLDSITLGDAAADILLVESTSTFNAPVTIDNTLDVTGNTAIGDNNVDTLTVEATSTFNSPVTVDSTFDVTGNSTLGDAAADTLTVQATSTFNAPVTVDSTFDVTGNSTIGDAATDTLVVNAGSTFNAPVTVDSTLNVTGNTVIGNDCATDTLDVTAVTTFNCDVTFSSPVGFEDLTVLGNTVLGDAATDTLDVTATSTFNSPVTIDSSLTVTGNMVLGDDCASDTLAITAQTTFNCPTTMLDALNVTGASVNVRSVAGNDPISIVGPSSTAGFTATLTSEALTADQTLTLPDITGTLITDADTGTVTSQMILDDTIVDADINTAAAIQVSKLEAFAAGSILIGDSATVPTITAITGDITLSDTGVTQIIPDVNLLSNPTTTTQLTTDNSTRIATTEFVQLRVDEAIQGLDSKNSARAATTGNITLSGTQTIDGVALVAGDRVLVKNQTDQTENGIYIVDGGGWTRATDMDVFNESVGAFIFVEGGTVNSDAGFVSQSVAGGTIGTDPIPFTQFSGAGQIIAGGGLTKTGNQLDVVTADATRIVVNSNSIDLATTGVAAGTYRSVTTDVYGRITAGTNPTTFAGYGISDTSANLRAALTDETGTGSAVFADSPALTGVPTAPTAAAGTNTTQLATTAFVAAAVSGGVALNSAEFLLGDATNATQKVTMSGDATLSNTGQLDIIDSVNLGGSPTTTTQAAGTNNTTIATTAFVSTATQLDSAEFLLGDASNVTQKVTMSGDATLSNTGQLDIIDSVNLGGSPTTTTQAAGTNNTTVATTAFVTAAVAAAAPQLNAAEFLLGDSANVTQKVTMSGDATLSDTGVLTIASNVALGGNPTTTTQAAGTSNTTIATTAFVQGAKLWEINSAQLRPVTASQDVVPRADGDASLGTGTLRWANVYTQDMHFSNEGTKGNDVDGTTGDWTLQEGRDHIFFINNKTGMKFRVVMEPA